MTFKNAYHGVRKIFTAQLLKVIGAGCMIIGMIIAVMALATGIVDEMASSASGTTTALGIGALAFVVGSGVLSIIAYFMNIVGLRQAGQDEDSFTMGFYAACFALIIKFLAILFRLLNVGGGIADNIADTVAYVCDILIVISVISGIVNLANRIGNEKIASLGAKLVNIVTAIIGLAAIANVLPVFFGVNETMMTVSGILELVAASLSIVGYIIYLVYLGKAVKMLREN